MALYVQNPSTESYKTLPRETTDVEMRRDALLMSRDINCLHINSQINMCTQQYPNDIKMS